MPISFTGGFRFDPMPPIYQYERIIIQQGEVSSKPEPHGPSIDLDQYIHIKLSKYFTVLLPKDHTQSELFEVWAWTQNYLKSLIDHEIKCVEEDGEPVDALYHHRVNTAKDRLNLTMSLGNLENILEFQYE
jgi:hypothetical protein